MGYLQLNPLVNLHWSHLAFRQDDLLVSQVCNHPSCRAVSLLVNLRAYHPVGRVECLRFNLPVSRQLNLLVSRRAILLASLADNRPGSLVLLHLTNPRADPLISRRVALVSLHQDYLPLFLHFNLQYAHLGFLLLTHLSFLHLYHPIDLRIIRQEDPAVVLVDFLRLCLALFRPVNQLPNLQVSHLLFQQESRVVNQQHIHLHCRQHVLVLSPLINQRESRRMPLVCFLREVLPANQLPAHPCSLPLCPQTNHLRFLLFNPLHLQARVLVRFRRTCRLYALALSPLVSQWVNLLPIQLAHPLATRLAVRHFTRQALQRICRPESQVVNHLLNQALLQLDCRQICRVADRRIPRQPLQVCQLVFPPLIRRKRL